MFHNNFYNNFDVQHFSPPSLSIDSVEQKKNKAVQFFLYQIQFYCLRHEESLTQWIAIVQKHFINFKIIWGVHHSFKLWHSVILCLKDRNSFFCIEIILNTTWRLFSFHRYSSVIVFPMSSLTAPIQKPLHCNVSVDVQAV